MMFPVKRGSGTPVWKYTRETNSSSTGGRGGVRDGDRDGDRDGVRDGDRDGVRDGDRDGVGPIGYDHQHHFID